MPGLSVCMIVRDEEAQLAGCLESVKEFADQMVIVDTGSVDNTVSIAESFGAEIYHFGWIDDFAAARNQSIKHATGDWRLWLDADERVDHSTAKFLRQLPKRAAKPTIYKVSLRNHKAEGDYVTMSMSHRIISHHSVIKFTGRIHEQVHPTAMAQGGVEKASNLILDHYGYALNEEEMKQKLARNRPILEAMVAEGENQTYALFTLGQNYSQTKNYEAAIETFNRAIAAGGFKGLSLVPLYNNLSESHFHLKHIEEAEDFAKRSVAITTDQTGGNYIHYRILQAKGDIPGQIGALNNVLRMSHRADAGHTGDVAQDVIIGTEHVLYTLSGLYQSVGEFVAAENAIRAYLAIQPDKPEAIEVLLKSLMGQEKWAACVEALDESSTANQERYRDVKGMSLLKLLRFDDAILFYEQWHDDAHDNSEIARRLAGLYAKVGRMDDATRMLSQISGDS